MLKYVIPENNGDVSAGWPVVPSPLGVEDSTKHKSNINTLSENNTFEKTAIEIIKEITNTI